MVAETKQWVAPGSSGTSWQATVLLRRKNAIAGQDIGHFEESEVRGAYVQVLLAEVKPSC